MRSKNLNLVVILIITTFSLSLSLDIDIIEAYSRQNSESLDELYDYFEPYKMNEILSASMEGMKTYVYSDALLSPPDDEYYPKLNITEELMKINVSIYRPFYEFYREYKRTLNKIKDIQLLVLPENLTLEHSYIEFSKYAVCLPFQFRMEYDENKNIKLFIKDFPSCSEYYNQSVKDFIASHENISLVSISDTDPFDFIQNFGKEFYDMKNPHARFSLMLRNIHIFYLNMIPLDMNETSNINFSFGEDEEDNLSISYHIIKPNNIFNKKEVNLIDKKEFDEFFEQEMKGKQGFGNIFEIKNKFLNIKNIYKNINSEKNEDEIEWNYKSDGLYCKVDEENKLNIFLQTKFYEEDSDANFYFIKNCVDLFYSNDYKIIGIESNCLGGSFMISYIFEQLLQPKLYFKYNLAQRSSSFNYLYYQKYRNEISNPDTCLPFDNINDFLGPEEDDYGQDIIHSRTKVYSALFKPKVHSINEYRKRLLKEGNKKKPTDILIFTDYSSSGAAGLFIKTLQNNGGAIIAGYLGNPKIEQDFDSTESVSLYENFQGTEINEMFKRNGFDIKSVSYAENFGKEYKNAEKTIYPMEYEINKVDERTNIIHEFNFNSYNEFILEAQKIFKKYNEENKCSSNNPNLLFENEKCYNSEENIYGGYICENGEWSNICDNFYCDVGYYYNIETKKCEIDPCSTDVYISLNFEGEKEYQIMPNISYILTIQSPQYLYSIQSPIDNLILHSNFVTCSRFCIIKNNENRYFYVNFYQKLTEPVIIKITGMISEGSAYSYKTNTIRRSEIVSIMGRFVYVFQFNQNEFGYMNTFDKGSKLFYAEYNDDMSLYDVVNINRDLFKDGKGKFIQFEIGKVYVLVFDVNLAFVQLYLSDSLDNEINIYQNQYNLLYLESEREYKLNIIEPKYPYLIKLKPISESESESSIEISNKDEIYTLNSSNKYFIPKEIEEYSSYIINNITENVIIEILSTFSNDSITILNETDWENLPLDTEITLIEYSVDEENNNKNLEIFLRSDDSFGLDVYAGPSKAPYFYYSNANHPNYSGLWVYNYQFKLDNPIKNIKLEEGEKYYISIIIKKKRDGQQVNLTYYYNKNPIEDLYEDLSEEYITNLISNLTSIINGYVYLDYAQNPDYIENYTHRPVDLISELNSINKKDRKFYEFYQEIKQILGAVMDLHFHFRAFKTPTKNSIDKIQACIPFSFYVDKDINDNNETKVYIKYFENCAVFFDEDVKNYIKKRSDEKIALKYINGSDPFDYIQNWGWKYFGVKNPHGEFSMKKNEIHSFALVEYPYTPQELNVTYEFESTNNETDYITLEYFIFVPNFQNVHKLYSYSNRNLLLNNFNFNEEEFDKFYRNEINKSKDNINLPNIFDILAKYMKH